MASGRVTANLSKYRDFDSLFTLDKPVAHAKDKFRNEQIACCNYAFENGIDNPKIVEWKWPY